MVAISRNIEISHLLNKSRFHVILTPVNYWFRGHKHMALLDCQKLEILEGYKDKTNSGSFVSTKVFPVQKKRNYRKLY